MKITGRRTEKEYQLECFKRKEDYGVVMNGKHIKCFYDEERNNKFSVPREDRKRINRLELQPGRFKIDIK